MFKANKNDPFYKALLQNLNNETAKTNKPKPLSHKNKLSNYSNNPIIPILLGVASFKVLHYLYQS